MPRAGERGDLTAGVAAIKGTYEGKVALRDPRHPEQFTMKAQGAGGPGTVDADVVVRLAPSAGGGTDLSYDADAAVGGVIGGVGQRMLAGVTRKMAGQFFEAVDDDIAGVRKEKKTKPVEVPSGPRPIEAVGTSTAGRGGPRDFGWGVLTGGAVAIAGVIVGWLIGGR